MDYLGYSTLKTNKNIIALENIFRIMNRVPETY